MPLTTKMKQDILVLNSEIKRDFFVFVFIGFVSVLGAVFVASILGVKRLDKGYSFLSFVVGLAYIMFPIIAGTSYHFFFQ